MSSPPVNRNIVLYALCALSTVIVARAVIVVRAMSATRQTSQNRARKTRQTFKYFVEDRKRLETVILVVGVRNQRIYVKLFHLIGLVQKRLFSFVCVFQIIL